MSHPPPTDSGSDPWSSMAFSSVIDNMLDQGSGITPHFPDRHVFSEAFGSFDASPQHPELPSLKMINMDPNPLNRFSRDPAEPWNPQQVFGNLGPEAMEARGYPRLHDHRGSPQSAVSSNRTGRPGDSGYGTKSGMSDPAQGQSEGSQSIAGDLQSLHVYQGHNSYDSNSVFSQDAQYGSGRVPYDEVGSGYPMKCQYQGCGKASKNHSDYKYVSLCKPAMNRLISTCLGSISRGILDPISALPVTAPRISVPPTIWKDTRSRSIR